MHVGPGGPAFFDRLPDPTRGIFVKTALAVGDRGAIIALTSEAVNRIIIWSPFAMQAYAVKELLTLDEGRVTIEVRLT